MSIELRCAADAVHEAAAIAHAVRTRGDFASVALIGAHPEAVLRLASACADAAIPVRGGWSNALVAFIESARKWIARGERVDAQRLVTSRFFGLDVPSGRAVAVAIERDLQADLSAPVATALAQLDHLRASAGASHPETLKEVGRILRFEHVLDEHERATFEALYLQAVQGNDQPAGSTSGVLIALLGEAQTARPRTIVSGLCARDFPRFLREVSGERALLEEVLAHAHEVILSYPQTREGRSTAPSPLLEPYGSARAWPQPSGAAFAAAPRGAIAALPVGARRLQFSASQLKTYDECRRKWYYRYVCSAVEEESSSAATYGKAVHFALERFHGEVRRPHEMDEVALRNRLEGEINEAFKRYANEFGSAIETELARRRALRTAHKYADWLIARARRRPFEVVACEQEVRLELEGFPFVGYIDRLDRDLESGNVTVIDYKTGVIAGDARSFSEDIANGHDFQLPFYYWAQRAAGERVASLALVPLKDELSPVEPLELEVAPLASQGQARSKTGVIPIAALERARTRMIELCKTIGSAQSAHFAPAQDAEACRYCSYLAACRERPDPVESRWAR